MPHSPRRRASAPSARRSADPGSRRSADPRRAADPGRPREPRQAGDAYNPAGSRGTGKSRGSGNPRKPAVRRPAGRLDPHAALEQALVVAAAAPQPPAATFADLGVAAPIVRALTAQGITEPFAIQARALPDALAGRNVLGRAQTGSGKTLAFGLALLTRLAGPAASKRPKAPRALILVPTRELAKQVADVLSPLARTVDLRVATVYGGVSIGRQIERVRDADVVVATPGRLLDLIERHACTLGAVEIAVIDEADHMADLGFLPPVTEILGQTPADGQRLLFSATLDRGVGSLVESFVTDPVPHAAEPAARIAPAEHSMLVLAAQDKLPVAAEIAGRPGRTLFFVRTKHGAERLAKQLTRAGVEANAIHGDRNQNQRQRALDDFAAGHPRVLVATDVAARGIHVDDLDLVVQFDPPNDHKDYLHRSGRTARAGASGAVVSLAEQAQVRELNKLIDAAGITPARHEVTVTHPVVGKIAASGTPIPPPTVTHEGPRPARRRSGSSRSNPAAARRPRSRGARQHG
jgi:superfamily II DNA/RNA helicase